MISSTSPQKNKSPTCTPALPMEDQITQLWDLMQSIHTDLCNREKKIKEHEDRLKELRKTQDTSQHVNFNVGGEHFTVSRDVLTNSRAEDSMLFAIGMGYFQDGENGQEVFIDRDGTLFGVILDWLRGSPETTDDSTDDIAAKQKPKVHALKHSYWHRGCSAEIGTPSEAWFGREGELSFLLTEADYYGMTKLCEEIREEMTTCRAAIRIGAFNVGEYERINAYTIRKKDTNEHTLGTIGNYFMKGYVGEAVIHFVDTDDFVISIVYDNTTLANCFTIDARGNLQKDGVNVVRILVDWTVPTAVEVYAEVNGAPWHIADNFTDWREKEYSFLTLQVASFVLDSTISLHSVW
eukprot:TRINITY_DN3996_c0_g1_i1.p1 TRINITY_DN3996_c0_g1~~TRINITY_DN3996_c0_g1_i1.p1  ORF type:complete len:351 (+),score=31.00 TRINITY_DN3996_c0_g1_i1:75-1127(+)